MLKPHTTEPKFDRNTSAPFQNNQVSSKTSVAWSDGFSSSATNNHHNSPPSHWESKIAESVVCLIERGLIRIQGGSDSGEFPYVGAVSHATKYLSGPKLQQGSIVLEVQGQQVAGYTRRDVVNWLNNCTHDKNVCVIKTLPPGCITRDLRQYLSCRFPKGGVDHDLQNTIRDNVYLRTVPVTTRPVRPGEVDGVDYTFLTPTEFQALQRSGTLLEAGIFEGNHYGTPKPPAQAEARSNSSAQTVCGAYPSSEGKRKRNRSNVEAMTANVMSSQTGLNESFTTSLPYRPPDIKKADAALTQDLGPLPPNWEMAHTESGEPYFIDHVAGTSSWLDPRLARVQKRNAEECAEDELPFGWERIDDPQYGTYYIDHVNKKTQYENPVVVAKQQVEDSTSLRAEEDISEYTKMTEPFVSQIQKSDDQVLADSDHRFQSDPPTNRLAFTRDPRELCGVFIRTTLTKSPRGLGFTIVGGDDHHDEFLQIKSVVPNGPAWQDAKLRTGDVLVYVNDTCVLGCSHADVVSMFQSIEPNESVYLEICRGYPLPFDPNDPNTEIVTTVAVASSYSGSPKTFGPNAFGGQRSRNNSAESMNTAKSMPDLTNTERVYVPRPGSADLLNSDTFEFQGLEVPSNFSKPEFISIPIVKGNMGFGFTIADSSDGQKVKKILDKSRCKTLREGDILMEINGYNVKAMSHSEVVQVLKDCCQGQEAAVLIQRGGLAFPSKSGSLLKKIPSLSPKKFGAATSRSTGGMYRSKTPTADMYSSQTKEVIPNRPKTPLVDTRKRVKTPTINEDRSMMDMNDKYYQHNPPYPGAFSYLGNNFDHEAKRKTVPNSYSHAACNGNSFDNTPEGSNYLGPEVSSDPYARQDRITNGYSCYNQSNDYPKHPPTNYESYLPNSYYNENSEYFASNADKFYDENLVNGNLCSLYSKGGYEAPSQDSLYSSQGYPSSQPFYPSYLGHNKQSQYQDGVYLADISAKKESTSFESEHPAPVPIPRFQLSKSSQRRVVEGVDDALVNFESREYNVTLLRKDNGFGFRIVGGTEEGSQVSVGHIVPGGSADSDGTMAMGDEIVRVDGDSVIGSSHHRVVQLMSKAAHNYRVSLTLRRNTHSATLASGVHTYPYDVTVHRKENEGFGFVIISSVTKSGSTIGRIIESSPAERCGLLHVGDRILRVNGVDIKNLHHGDIVNLIKESGYTVTLTIGQPRDDASSTASTSQKAESETGEDVEVLRVDLERGSRGFGFSIRGGKEFHNMPLFVLRIAEGGPAGQHNKLKVGDQLLEINQIGTRDMTHADAIELIKQSGSIVSLLVRRGGKLPAILDPSMHLNSINFGSPLGPPPPGTMIRSTSTLPHFSPTNGSSFSNLDQYSGPGPQPGYATEPQRFLTHPFHSSPAAQFASTGPPLGQSSPRTGPSYQNNFWNH